MYLALVSTLLYDLQRKHKRYSNMIKTLKITFNNYRVTSFKRCLPIRRRIIKKFARKKRRILEEKLKGRVLLRQIE